MKNVKIYDGSWDGVGGASSGFPIEKVACAPVLAKMNHFAGYRGFFPSQHVQYVRSAAFRRISLQSGRCCTTRCAGVTRQLGKSRAAGWFGPWGFFFEHVEGRRPGWRFFDKASAQRFLVHEFAPAPR